MDKKLYEKLADKIIPIRPPDFGITVTEFSEATPCSQGMAKAILDKAGLLKTKMRDGKATPIVYHEKPI